MKSLYSKIKEKAKIYFPSSLDRNGWNELSSEKQKTIRDFIVNDFIEEKTEVWVAAALTLGRLAVLDQL